MAGVRIEWIDALRGAGMILVVLGHMAIPELARRFIFSFHMPLFFFLSGYCYKGGFSRRWVLRKIDSLLVPYFVYSTAMLALLVSLGKCRLGFGSACLFSGNGVGITWFLTCLFIVELLGGWLVSQMSCCEGSPRARCLFRISAIFVVAVVGWGLPRLGLRPVLKSNTVFSALTFWLWGHYLKGMKFNRLQLICAFVAASFFWVQRVDMNSGRLGNGFLFYGTAMGFIVILMWLFERYNIKLELLIFIGRRSLEIMCLHAMIPMFTTIILSVCGCEMPRYLFRVITLLLLIMAAYLIHKHSRLLSGRAEIFQRIGK